MMRMILAGTLLLGACGESEPEAFKPLTEYREIGGGATAMTFPAKLGRAAIEAGIRGYCEGKQFCKVMGWGDRAFAASAMPMTDREVAALHVSYTLNRATGYEQLLWNCKLEKGVPPESCL